MFYRACIPDQPVSRGYRNVTQHVNHRDQACVTSLVFTHTWTAHVGIKTQSIWGLSFHMKRCVFQNGKATISINIPQDLNHYLCISMGFIWKCPLFAS